jgi:formylglycine-generating enzyme required for sulfatase activity
VSWKDAQAFAAWLSQQTGKNYRLMTEAEWEYAARGGTTSRYYFGDEVGDFCRYGNATDQTRKRAQPNLSEVLPCSDGYVYTAPVGRFLPNKFGVYDALGNVRQLVEDCWNASYDNAPSDGSAWTGEGDCARRVNRGSSWGTLSSSLRLAIRTWGTINFRANVLGFRVVRVLAP